MKGSLQYGGSTQYIAVENTLAIYCEVVIYCDCSFLLPMGALLWDRFIFPAFVSFLSPCISQAMPAILLPIKSLKHSFKLIPLHIAGYACDTATNKSLKHSFKLIPLHIAGYACDTATNKEFET